MEHIATVAMHFMVVFYDYHTPRVESYALPHCPPPPPFPYLQPTPNNLTILTLSNIIINRYNHTMFMALAAWPSWGPSGEVGTSPTGGPGLTGWQGGLPCIPCRYGDTCMPVDPHYNTCIPRGTCGGGGPSRG